ncbi:MAG: Lipase/esterase [Frankiales bacterium]|nr:Lipase/esterase [Frankiales bacterium]
MQKLTRPDGAEIAWYDEGSGPAVLMVMGLAYPAAAWHRQVPVLARTHRVITVDNRGAGATGLVPGSPYTVETMTDDLRAVLDAAGEVAAHVVGISMGGLMAQELALSHPERCLSLTLISTHPGTANGVWPQEVVDFLQARLGMPAEERAEFSIPFNYAPATPRTLMDEDLAVREAGTAGPEGYAAQGGTALWSGWERLPSMTVRTLVLHGAQDRLVVPANGERIASAIPDAKLILVEGANHLVTTDQADQVNDLLLGWFG